MIAAMFRLMFFYEMKAKGRDTCSLANTWHSYYSYGSIRAPLGLPL